MLHDKESAAARVRVGGGFNDSASSKNHSQYSTAIRVCVVCSKTSSIPNKDTTLASRCYSHMSLETVLPVDNREVKVKANPHAQESVDLRHAWAAAVNTCPDYTSLAQCQNTRLPHPHDTQHQMAAEPVRLSPSEEACSRAECGFL